MTPRPRPKRPRRRRRALWTALGAGLLAVTLLIQGCLHVPKYAASGVVAGYPLSGPVDSAVARDYLQGQSLPEELHTMRQQFLERGQVPSRDELNAIAHAYSPDVATLLFVETLSATPETRALRDAFEAELAHIRAVGLEQARPALPENLLVLLVPGWFYVTHGSATGADFKAQRETFDRMGVANQLVPIAENGTVEANARAVANAIRDASRNGHRLVLVSASKSGPEVAQALGRELRADETTAVLGWVSIGGVVRGTPLADRVLRPDLCWLVELKFGFDGFDLEGAKSMQTTRAGAAFATAALPPHIRTVAFIPVPLSGQITKRGSLGYVCLRPHGPNDGFALLADELLPGGAAFLAVGVDHFLDHPDRNLWTAAMFRALMNDHTRDR